jgi:hypothetical protein
MLAIQQIMIRYSMESKLVSQSVFGFVYYMILLQYDISSPPTSCREQVRNLVDFLIIVGADNDVDEIGFDADAGSDVETLT